MVTIKVALGTLKVLVEDHGSRLGFSHLDDGEIYSGPSQRYHIHTACKHVTRSQGCRITKRVKNTCQVTRLNYVWLIPMIGSRKSKISTFMVHTITRFIIECVEIITDL
jgi:hypothetical protein